MDGVKITKRPKLKKPYMIVAWPGMGEVAFKAASYLVEKLKAEEFAVIPAEEFFYLTGSVIKEGILSVPDLPSGKFYFWKNKNGKNDLIIFISNAQPDLAKAEEYSKRILYVAKLFKIDTLVGFASMPLPIDHTQSPAVWFAATHPEIRESLKKYNLNMLNEGQVSGMNGLFLGIAKQEGFKGFCLLGEMPLYTIQIDNPKAAQAVLVVFSKIYDIKIDFAGLVEQVHAMEAEINKLMDYLKTGTPGQPTPINEEEIEKIKRALSQLTKLPVSVKDRIEKLFAEATSDLKKAHELKAELDKWNVYKDYEDRFLDLFRNAKDKGN
ncbi:MAG: PAC2 family protein [Candidatus Omnitrophica bacterium]|nr:PAC2 family protein [Candidatus Omnitrophota bacterium]